MLGSLIAAQGNLILAGSEESIEEVTADKGYHSNAAISDCSGFGVRTYIPELELKYERVWADKPEEYERSMTNNRQRMRRSKGKRLQRQRSEKVERSFAHTCETGGARRTWLRGMEKINKRYLLQAASRNLGTLMRSLFGTGSPLGLQGAVWGLFGLYIAVIEWLCGLPGASSRLRSVRTNNRLIKTAHENHRHYLPTSQRIAMFSTGC
ncbi:hypothetical protein Pla110_24850 [Polystyrenella longa]|uniref:Transposase DDE domain-containing protein n=1 Tax=Polystyrenella longa TaxID=2528007 RepID=A0A518CNF0_9PLAN|nr:hypothetical protein Pla110_24850 [Polystyrenella longa]